MKGQQLILLFFTLTFSPLFARAPLIFFPTQKTKSGDAIKEAVKKTEEVKGHVEKTLQGKTSCAPSGSEEVQQNKEERPEKRALLPLYKLSLSVSEYSDKLKATVTATLGQKIKGGSNPKIEKILKGKEIEKYGTLTWSCPDHSPRCQTPPQHIDKVIVTRDIGDLKSIGKDITVKASFTPIKKSHEKSTLSHEVIIKTCDFLRENCHNLREKIIDKENGTKELLTQKDPAPSFSFGTGGGIPLTYPRPPGASLVSPSPYLSPFIL